MNESVRRKLTKARIALITLQPFFGTLALRLKLIENNSIPTLAVNGREILYNAAFVDKLSHEVLMAAVAHEVGHCVYEHISRRGARNPMKWNFAGDYVINAMLKSAGFTLGEGWLYNPQWGSDMTADQIYNLLPDQPQNGNGGGLPGPGEPGGPLCDIQQGDAKEDHDLADEWKIATVQAATAAQQAGKLPGDLKRFITDLLNPKTDWRTQLRRFVTEVSNGDYSWTRPQRKMLAHGFYMPSLYSERMGEIVVAVDTSGSITQHMLNVFQAEIQAIRDAVSPQMTRIIYCDARVNHVDEFTAEDLLEMKMHGGGGTDFRPPFDLVEEEGWNPAAFIYLTDGYGPFPQLPAPNPTMWCMTTNVEPPHGECLQVDAD